MVATRGRTLLLTSLLCATAAPTGAHEFWLEPAQYSADVDTSVAIEIRNGEYFDGEELPYLPSRLRRFESIDSLGRRTVEARTGDLPAGTLMLRVAGSTIVFYESQPATLRYPDFAGFRNFAETEGVEHILEVHEARGLPRENVTERFTRYAKTLLQVEGGSAPMDRRVGLPLELMLSRLEGHADAPAFEVQLLYRGQPLRGAQLSIFERLPEGTVEIRRLRFDDEGVATFETADDGRAVLLNSVHAVAASPRDMLTDGVAWETHWASLTFVPPSFDR